MHISIQRFEKIFSPRNLLILNGAIIIIAFATGSFFMDTGLIHAIAIFFIALSIVRIFISYYSYDAFLEKFFHMAVVAFVIFSFSHFVEFFSYRVLHLSDEVTFANVANFYIVALLVLTIGAERFLQKYDRRNTFFMWVLIIVTIAFVLPIAGLYFKENLISFELNAFGFYVYIFLALMASGLALWKIGRLGKLVSISSGFVRYVRWAMVLVTLSILTEVFYEMLKDSVFQVYQIIYLSHFLFYGGMTLIFLAFGTLAGIKKTGMYKENQKLEG